MATESVFIEFKVELDNQFFDDIICTMLEGGSNYWIDHIIINHPHSKQPRGMARSEWASAAINEGGIVCISPTDKTYCIILTKRRLIRGLKSWMLAYPNEVDIINIDGKNTIDAGNIDAGIADKILQYALFEDIVYG